MFNPCFRYIYCLRKSSEYSKWHPIGIIYRILYRRYSYKYGIQISKTVRICRRFSVINYGGIVINSKSEIGENCTILQGVTLANTQRGQYMGPPVIGTNVYIDPGAVLDRKVTVGNNVLVAPSSYVNFNIPDDSIVKDNPAKVISKLDATKGYIINPIT
jgi:serine O-acetyltransferase